MNNINNLLLNAEELHNRIKQQAEQESAMVQVLPIRFQKNIEAFYKYIPSIADKFGSFKPNRSFEFFCNENGIPNLRWLDDNVAIYGDDPYLLCQKQIEDVIEKAKLVRMNFSGHEETHDQIHVEFMNQLGALHRKATETLTINDQVSDSVPLAIMFGVGLGYQVSYFYEKCTPKNFFIFEPDSDLFYASLFTFDWYVLLDFINENNLGLHIFVGQNENDLIQDMNDVLIKRSVFVASTIFAFWHYPSEAIFSLIKKATEEFYLINTGWGFFDDNLYALSHSIENIENNEKFLFDQIKVPENLQNIPVFVIGNGPSLDSTISYIKKYQEKAILIACGSAISALYRAGIKPDICVAVERVKSMADFYGVIDADNYLKDILFFSSDIVHPDCLEYFSRSFLCFKKNEPMYYLLCANGIDKIDDFSALECINPLVGNIGLNLPIALGFINLFMFGLDNGYKDESHHHSKISAYYDAEGNPLDTLTKNIINQQGTLLPGNFGGEVIANNFFATSVKVMELLLRLSPNINCFNCSDGAFVNGAAPLHAEDIVISSDVVDKKSLADYIYNEMCSPLDISVDLLKNSLNTDVFDETIENIISLLSKEFSSRDELLDRMISIHEYIYSLIKDGYPHIYRVLYGSVTYMFASVTVLAYGYNQDNKLLIILNEAVSVMMEYFRTMKLKYPQAFESKDSTDRGTYQLFKSR